MESDLQRSLKRIIDADEEVVDNLESDLVKKEVKEIRSLWKEIKRKEKDTQRGVHNE